MEALIYLVITIAILAGIWKTFTKAGQPGWASLIPIYNMYILLCMAQRPAWWLILLFIPVVNIIISIMIYMDIAAKFGKGTGFAIGLLLLPFIFFPILGFSDAQYTVSSDQSGEEAEVEAVQ